MLMYLIISFFLIITGIAMIIIWLSDIDNKADIDFSEGFFKAREKDSGNVFWFHIITELITGILLIFSGIILLSSVIRLLPLVYFSLGLLFYSSFNSLGWAFASKSRASYRIPMISGLLISVLSFLILLIG